MSSPSYRRVRPLCVVDVLRPKSSHACAHHVFRTREIRRERTTRVVQRNGFARTSLKYSMNSRSLRRAHPGGSERSPRKSAPNEDAEPNSFVEPRTMLRRVHESDPVRLVRQETPATRNVEYRYPFYRVASMFSLPRRAEPALPNNASWHIRHEDPTRLCIGRDRCRWARSPARRVLGPASARGSSRSRRRDSRSDRASRGACIQTPVVIATRSCRLCRSRAPNA